MLIKVSQLRRKLIKIPPNFLSQYRSIVDNTSVKDNSNNNDFKDWKEKLHSTMKVYENFINDEEEKSLINEVDPYLKRLRYEYDHWDDRIHAYRETEFSKWNDENLKIINKLYNFF